MSKFEKLILKLKKAPTDLRYGVAHNLLVNCGFNLVAKSGSHMKYRNNDNKTITIVTHNNKVGKFYIKDMINILNL